MSRLSITPFVVAVALLLAREAGAQPLGSFTWQLQPFCNRVTVNVTQNGGIYTLDGYDDQCSAAQRAPLVGLATPNSDGTIGLGFHLVTVPGGKTVSVEVRLTPGPYNGPWSDSAGNSGTAVLNGSNAGSPRPAPAGVGITPGSVTTTAIAAGAVTTASIADSTVGAADVDPAQVQLRLSGSCPTGQFMVGSASTGAVTCSDGATIGGSTSTALGTNALANAATGGRNTAIGGNALSANTAIGNTALGYDALRANISGSSNVALGDSALADNTTGGAHVAVGLRALWHNVDGIRSVAVGNGALETNTTGDYNVAVGASALSINVGGSNNVGVGERALLGSIGSNNTGVGYRALASTTSSNNTALGYQAGANVTIGLNNVHIANQGLVADNNTIKIGTVGTQTAAYLAGVRGVTVPTGIPVIVGTDGQLGTTTSSRRFKEDIQDMGELSARLARLRPVTFRYTQPAADGTKPQDFGLIAEEVADVFPELAVRSADGTIETVAYHKLPALLLNELQRQQRVIDEQAKRISEIDALKAELAEMRTALGLVRR